MRFDWLKLLRSPWHSIRKDHRRGITRRLEKSDTHTVVEALEPRAMLTVDVYVNSAANLTILEGDSVNIWSMSAGTGSGTLNYRIENTDRGLDGTTYETTFDGTASFSGPMQGFQLTIS